MVVSHVMHYQYQGQLYAYGPYTREIDIWADLFPQILIASPCRSEEPPGDCIPFKRANIAMVRQPETGGDTLREKAVQILLLPWLVWSLCRAMRKADAIHVRCPGNLGLLGILLAPLYSPRLVAKYAGQWSGYETERWNHRLQRALLRSRWWRGPVTVYGKWPGDPDHVVPFFTSMMTRTQLEHALDVAASKSITPTLRVLFSGRLADSKRADFLLDAAAMAREKGVDLEVAIVGDGPLRADLERHAERLGIAQHVKFTGGLPYDEALRWYEWAHCLVLPSSGEGWPKVVAEAMCHGLVCISSAKGHVPSMLQGRGIVLSTGETQELASILQNMARHPEEFEPLARRASEWASGYSLEGLRDAIAQLLSQWW
jgi:glycosyltransferase involved in cell wall biosynthesis